MKENSEVLLPVNDRKSVTPMALETTTNITILGVKQDGLPLFKSLRRRIFPKLQ